MKVSYRWLSDYVDLSGYTGEELAEKFTRGGIEVDVVESRNLGVNNVVVGYVKSREKHPDADKLSVCVIDAGQGEDLQIVCGAKNIDAGQKVPVALVGAKLPGGLDIKRAKLRGVESMGMICSAKELGLNDKLLPKEIQEGILVLPADTQVGDSILEVLAIDDEVLELDLTPNRSDCLSMLGAAYEVGAVLDRQVKLPDTESGLSGSSKKASDSISVKISATEQCSHYAARLIEGVTITSSPLWMQNRLMAAGIRPINNIVDITNYVMLEYGQPLHAFDADKVANEHIDVRLAKEGETLTTLDDAERKLEPHMLLITDGVKPIALAGVMGGANSEVTEGTTRILLESAKFDGGSVRKTSRQLGLRSEASLRFEKEVDPARVIPALNRAAQLIAQYGGGQVAEGIVEAKTTEHEPVKVSVTLEKINGYLGTELTLDQVKAIFDRLNFTYDGAGSELTVHVPSRRGDITRDVDLIEEAARLHGYDNIPTTLMQGVTTAGSLTKEQKLRRVIRNELTALGFHEAVTYAFTHPQHMEQYPGLFGASKQVALAMPMSEDRSVLRTSLIPHMLEAVTYNRNRNQDDVALFEMSKVFVTDEDQLTKQPEEKLLLSIVWTGKREASHWSGKPGKVDFYDLKGAFEALTQKLGVEGVQYASAAPAGFHPGRTAEISLANGTRLGWMGQLHPSLQAAKDLEDTYVLEIELAPLLGVADYTISYKMLPRFPAMTRDIAVVVGREVPVGSLLSDVQTVGGSLLEATEVFDIYTGERLGADKKSVAISLVYRHPERTLTDEEVTELHGKVVQSLEQKFGAELRK